MLLRITSALAFSLSLVVMVACGEHEHDGYESLQACFDEHTGDEGLTVEQSITVCTLEHPIDGEALNFATAAECVTYVTANLSAGSATAAQIMAGCDEYISQKGM